MGETTLETINNSIKQLNNRIDDTNKSMKRLIDENNTSHRDINRKVENISSTISDIDKESSITDTNLNNHLDEHKKEDEKSNINGVKVTSIISNLSAALIGAFVALKVA